MRTLQAVELDMDAVIMDADTAIECVIRGASGKIYVGPSISNYRLLLAKIKVEILRTRKVEVALSNLNSWLPTIPGNPFFLGVNKEITTLIKKLKPLQAEHVAIRDAVVPVAQAEEEVSYW